MTERFTSGLVSHAAKRAWQAQRPQSAATFEPERANGHRGWRMFAWQSQIDMARAMGRGDAAGRGVQPHSFDAR